MTRSLARQSVDEVHGVDVGTQCGQMASGLVSVSSRFAHPPSGDGGYERRRDFVIHDNDHASESGASTGSGRAVRSTTSFASAR